MSETFLQTVTEQARARIARTKDVTDLAALRKSASEIRSSAMPFRLRQALGKDLGANIIAEIKRASPSKGLINAQADVVQLARTYEAGGAAAISVLTEEAYFQGSLDDLRAIRSAVSLPILRKDFIVDEIQILEAAVAGADAVLLIVAALSPDVLGHLNRFTSELGMDALVEAHSQEEMAIAAKHGATIVGINNRDLHTLEVSLEVSRTLITKRPDGAFMVAESGISTLDDVKQLRHLGFDGFLIGEALMRDTDPRGTLERWI